MKTFEKDGYTFQEWRIGASTFTACMTLGARLMSWTIDVAGNRREVIRWPENADFS